MTAIEPNSTWLPSRFKRSSPRWLRAKLPSPSRVNIEIKSSPKTILFKAYKPFSQILKRKTTLSLALKPAL
ncbi:MAG: hypothetical protein DJ555_04410 [Desulfurococcaceae archaeon]|nr:MAG: hypothetical protein DJ555_04410 [Desulfurococcaceae archaeon]